MIYTTFTKEYSNFNGRVITEEQVKYNNRYVSLTAAWDTGSTCTCISPELVEYLNMKPYSNPNELKITQGNTKSNLYKIIVILNDELEIPANVYIHPHIHEDDVDLLIGMDIIQKGDFAISNHNDNTCFSYRFPSKGLIDFTRQ